MLLDYVNRHIPHGMSVVDRSLKFLLEEDGTGGAGTEDDDDGHVDGGYSVKEMAEKIFDDVMRRGASSMVVRRRRVYMWEEWGRVGEE